jgi:hypothetical protein
MPPYGTPPHPYVAMYPHGGIYAHPSMPPVFLVIALVAVLRLSLYPHVLHVNNSFCYEIISQAGILSF